MNNAFLEAGRFLLYFLTAFFVIGFLFSFIPYEFFALVFAKITIFILALLGIAGEIYSKSPVLLELGIFKEKILISYLCTGLLELKVISSAIIATKGKNFFEKFFGILFSILFITIFNTFRIVASILIIYWFGLEVGYFSHDLLFRVFLFFSVFVFYAFWLFYSFRFSKFFKNLI